MENSPPDSKLEENVKTYEVGCCKELGQFLLAKKDFKPGDIIVVDSPLLYGPQNCQKLICVGCCKKLEDESKFCMVCGWPICSTQCDKLTEIHSVECQILKLCPIKEGETSFRYDILLFLRGLLLPVVNKDKWGILMNLEDQNNDRYMNSEFLKKVHEKNSFVQEIYIKPLRIHERETGKNIMPKMPNYIVKRLSGVLNANSFEYNDNVQLIYPTASIFEQSCLPNTFYTVDAKNGYTITIRAITPIVKGQHLTLSYANLLWGTQERKDYMKKLRHLSCSCPRCIDPTELGTYFGAMICFGSEAEPCKGVQLPLNPTHKNPTWICNKCDIKLPDKEVFKFVQHLSKEVDKMLKTRPKVDELKELLGKLERFLHSHHYLVHRVKYELVQVLSVEENDSLQDKLKLCRDLIDVVKTLDPIRIRLGIHLYSLLRAQFIGKTTLLYKSYSEDNKDDYIDMIKDILSILKESKEIATFQNFIGFGNSLLGEVSNNEDTFSTWLIEHAIVNEKM